MKHSKLIKQKNIKFSQVQFDTLMKLKNVYKIKIDTFIRDAIKEKIQREYKQIKQKNNVVCPF